MWIRFFFRLPFGVGIESAMAQACGLDLKVGLKRDQSSGSSEPCFYKSSKRNLSTKAKREREIQREREKERVRERQTDRDRESEHCNKA